VPRRFPAGAYIHPEAVQPTEIARGVEAEFHRSAESALPSAMTFDDCRPVSADNLLSPHLAKNVGKPSGCGLQTWRPAGDYTNIPYVHGGAPAMTPGNSGTVCWQGTQQ